MTIQLTTEQVWQAIEKELFAVIGMVTTRHEARTVGVVYVARDRKLYIGTGKDTWKVRHIAGNPHVSVTIPITKRIPFLPWIKIPAATITFSGTARILLPAETPLDILQTVFRGLAEEEEMIANAALIEVTPEKDFVTYGVGVSLMTMRNPEKARGRAPVGINFRRYIAYTADKAPTNSPYEFLAFCGVVGLGRLLAEGDTDLLEILRRCASDPRWRIREAVATALQRLGDVNMEWLIAAMRDWGQGTPLEQRAAAAALCEPRLLGQAQAARATLEILDQITAGIEQAANRRSEDFLALRKGLGYCWSVAVVALPAEGKALMEKWLVKSDKDIRWIMRENLKKARLVRMDAEWVKRWRDKF
jgi:hypothetical protein